MQHKAGTVSVFAMIGTEDKTNNRGSQTSDSR